jgi:hypothetical protein
MFHKFLKTETKAFELSSNSKFKSIRENSVFKCGRTNLNYTGSNAQVLS